MQTISSNLKAALIDIDARVTPRTLVDTYELYAADYVPGVSGFDPADAIETFAAETLTWNGIAYRREVISRGDILRNMGEKTNSVTLTFSNISRYLATLAQSQTIEGLFLVIRCVVPSVTDDSLVLFVGRCDKPSDIDKKTFSLSARQDFGNINQTLPPRRFTAEDPDGRLPSDPLYEGIQFHAVGGSFTFPEVIPAGGIAGLLGRRRTVTRTEQWSSADKTPYGSVIPEVFGRCQMQLITFAAADKGVFVTYLMAACNGPIDAITNIKSRTAGVSDPFNLPGPIGAVVHLGDLGGTGTNTGNTNQADLGGGQVFSHLAYIEGASVPNELLQNPNFSDPNALNEPPEVTALILGRKVSVPNSSGVYDSEAWSDNPVNLARFVLTNPAFVNIDPAFMEDAVNYLTARHCDQPLTDDTQLITVQSPDILQAGDSFTRYRSTGLITPRYFLYNYLGDVSVVPETIDGPYVSYDSAAGIDEPPVVCDVGYHHDLITGECVPNVTGGGPTGGGPVAVGDVQLTSGVALGSQTVGEFVWKFYYIDVLPGATQIQVVLTGSGDCATHTRPLAKPTLTTYACRAYTASPQTCTTANPAAGRWWIGIYGYGGGASYSLTATITGGSGSGPTGTPGNDTQPLLRKRYTANCPITDEVRAVDFLYKTLFPAFKGFMRVNKYGRYEIRSEKSSDSTRLRTATSVGATSVPVLDVTPWKSGDLLTGRLLIGVALETAEVRNVSAAVYSTSGNSITLTSQGSGGTTATASGSTLSGGSTTVQASGTVTIGGTPVAGDIVLITINGIVISYEVTSDDTTGTIAAMLSAYINATKKLSLFVSSEWAAASPTVITIKCLHGALTVDSPLLKAHDTSIADPTTPPTIAASGSGALPAGAFQVAYADVTANGLTALTQVSTITLTAGQKIDVSSLPALVGTSRQFFISESPNSTKLRFVTERVNASNFSINSLPSPGAALAPTYNTTAEEMIRVAMSFATNSQDVYPCWAALTVIPLNDIRLPTVPNGHKYQASAGTTGSSEPTWPTTAGGTVVDGTVTWTEIGSTVLQQAGLTRANIVKDTFNWPMGSQQSSVNQIKIAYRDATNDFALTPFRVNDPVHYAQVKKWYPLEVDGSAIDNFHQMFRIANWMLSKNREGDWFDSLETGPQGLILEEGDPICASDDSGGLINVVTRIEELRIKPNHDVSITRARKYSTAMFSDDVGSHHIPIASTLRYVQTLDSILEFIDTPGTREADRINPPSGFYVSVSRDLASSGDWRGWALYADYGDGDVKVAENTVPATLGVTTSTLADVADTTVLDATNDLDFSLKYVAEPVPFSTCTEADLVANPRKNLFLVGDEYIQAATIVDNGDRTFTISDLFHARFNSECVAHSVGERIIYIDGAETFVKTDLSRIGTAYNYKAVTTNQDVADATPVSFTWQGNILKPYAVTDINVRIDAFGDFLIEFTGHAREVELPALWKVDIYDTSFANYKGTLPVTANTTHACLMNAVHVQYGMGAGTPPDETPLPGGTGTVTTTTSTDKNNLFSYPWDGVFVAGPEAGSLVSGVTLEEINSTFQRFDCTLQWLGADGAGSNAVMTVALQTRADADPVSDLFTPDLTVSPLAVVWTAGTDPGTVKETVKSFNVTIAERDNLDPGYGNTFADTATSTGGSQDASTYLVYRQGQRYTFAVVGSEYRLYLDFGSQSQKLLAVVASDENGPAYPLRLAGETSAPIVGAMGIMNITRGGDQLSTIFSVRDQIEKLGAQIDVPGSEHAYFRIYQAGKPGMPDGVSVDVIAPPI